MTEGSGGGGPSGGGGFSVLEGGVGGAWEMRGRWGRR